MAAGRAVFLIHPALSVLPVRRAQLAFEDLAARIARQRRDEIDRARALVARELPTAEVGQALKADVIDRDELATGERKEGAYFAAWSFVSKVASGIMIGSVGFALDLSGFAAGVEEQSEAAVRAMIFLSGRMPLLGFAAGMWLFRGFGLTQDEHARGLAALAKRRPS
jgi:hypothetical protein